MELLINKDSLVAEIENLLDKGKYHEEYDCAYRDGNNDALYALKGKLETLLTERMYDVDNKILLKKGGLYIISTHPYEEVDVTEYILDMFLKVLEKRRETAYENAIINQLKNR